MKKLKILVFALLAIGIISISTLSIADVGDFESYDSDWGSSWDSDWDSSDDYYYGGNGHSGSSDDPVAGLIFMVLFITTIIVLSKKQQSNTNYSGNVQPRGNYIRNEQRSKNVANKIREVDKYFNDEKFLAWTKNLFIKLQNAWSARDWETIRTFESEDLFEQHSTQLKGYIERKQINKMERICVNFAELVSFSQDNDKDEVVVALNSSMTDYIIDETTGNIIKGSKDYRRTNTYKLTFIRKKGVLTEEGTEKLKTTNCPNCGAPTTITSSGKCEFCGSVITTGSHDWILSNMERF